MRCLSEREVLRIVAGDRFPILYPLAPICADLIDVFHGGLMAKKLGALGPKFAPDELLNPPCQGRAVAPAVPMRRGKRRPGQ